MGSSPATGPTQNVGQEAKGIQAAAALVDGLAMILPLVGASSPLGKSLAKAMIDIGKHVPEGAGTEAGKKNQLQSQMLKQQQMAPQMAAMKAQGAAPPGGIAPPPPGAAPPGGAPPGGPPPGADA